MNRKVSPKFFLWLAPLFLGACMLFPASAVPSFAPTQPPGMIHTAAAQTIVAQLTQSTGATAVAQLTQIASSAQPTPLVASPTPPVLFPATALPPAITPQPPVFLPTAAPTWAPPTWTAIPPWPAWPTWGPPPPLPTPVTQPCDWVQFVKDMSYPDGSLLTPGQAFSKTWRLRNIGSCTWTANYSLVFVSGDRMQMRNAYGLSKIVRPGESVDVSADFVAPTSGGHYRGYWMLSNASGRTFGVGPQAQTPFWVDVTVRATDIGANYSFVANYCTAQWDNGYAVLPCPGDSADPQGSIRRLNDPTLETGKHENEPALWTRPYAAPGGTISGAYPAFRVQAGDRFLSDIGCLSGSKGCNVIFSLDYQAAGQPVHSLGSWHEVYDRQINRVDIDLSGLAGMNVQFILRVENRGKSGDADAFWLGAQIRRGGPVDPGWGNIPAVQAAVQTLARDLNVPAGAVSVSQVEPVQWPDACLGLNLPGQMCAQVITPGYRMILTVNGRSYEVHTNQAGSIALWERR